MVLEKGRPADCAGRLEKEIRCYDLLEQLGIEFWRVDHPAANTIEACAEVIEVLDSAICKNLFLCNRQKTVFYLLMIPGDKVFKTKELSAQIGTSRLSFAGAEEMEQHLDITPGSVSVMGLMNDREKKVNLLVDEDLLSSEWVGLHPCINTSSLRIRTADVFGPLLKAMDHEMRIVTLSGE